jgi:hypothetical protein
MAARRDLAAGRVTSARQLDLIGLDLNADYAAIYASQPWIYALVNKVTRNIARLPLAPSARTRDVHREPLPRTHPLPALLSRPFPRGSRSGSSSRPSGR